MKVFGLVTAILLVSANIEAQDTGSGAIETHQQQCSDVRIDGYVMINGRPSKILLIFTPEPGMVKLVAEDIILGRTYEHTCQSTDNIEVPNVPKKQYRLLNFDDEDDVLLLMDGYGNIRDDLELPRDQIGYEIRHKVRSRERGILLETSIFAGDEAVTGIIEPVERGQSGGNPYEQNPPFLNAFK